MSRETPTYSDLLETVSQHVTHEGLQTVQPEKIVYTGHQELPIPVRQNGVDGFGDWDADRRHNHREHHQDQRKGRRICGLTPWVFWVIASIVAVVVIAAAVGGGVAGSQAQNNNDLSATNGLATAVTSVQQPSITASTSTTPSFTTTEVTRATKTLLSDCPSSNNTLYSYGSSQHPMLFRKVCGQAFYQVGGDNDLKVNEPVASLNDCIDQCAIFNVHYEAEIGAGVKEPCNAVCWWNTFDVSDPGQCFGSLTQNVTGTFSFQDRDGPVTVCDSAAWINQPS